MQAADRSERLGMLILAILGSLLGLEPVSLHGNFLWRNPFIFGASNE
jgi:hypothetical protein